MWPIDGAMNTTRATGRTLRLLANTPFVDWLCRLKTTALKDFEPLAVLTALVDFVLLAACVDAACTATAGVIATANVITTPQTLRRTPAAIRVPACTLSRFATGHP